MQWDSGSWTVQGTKAAANIGDIKIVIIDGGLLAIPNETVFIFLKAKL